MDQKPRRHRSRDKRKPYLARSTTELIALLAIKTHISPRELLATPPGILEAMIQIAIPEDYWKEPTDAWQLLAQAVSATE